MMADMDELIAQLCRQAMADRLFPGCTVGYIDGDQRHIMAFGRQTYDAKSPVVAANTIYDTASVTKSVVTSLVALKLIEDGRLQLEEPVTDYVPELQNEYREQITIWNLLTYTVVFDIPGGLSALTKQAPTEVFERLCHSPLMAPPGDRYFYTNPPAIILAKVVERLTGASLEDLAQTWLFRPLNMADSTLRPENLSLERIAPTEIDERGEVRGIVHDEPAWAMLQAGHLPGNAGLFSTTPDLLHLAQMLLEGGTHEGKALYLPDTVTLMHTNQIANLGATTGLGWELNWPLVMGHEISPQAFGKTGFTGCIIIVDPLQDKALVHLSNRIYPHRQPNRDGINAFRRALSDIIFAA